MQGINLLKKHQSFKEKDSWLGVNKRAGGETFVAWKQIRKASVNDWQTIFMKKMNDIYRNYGLKSSDESQVEKDSVSE